MRANKSTRELIKGFEGLSLEAYRDAAGYWTIGYGFAETNGLDPKPRAGMRITKAEADALLERNLRDYEKAVGDAVTAPINENEFGAFVSLCFNIGPPAFRRSTALRRFNAGDKRGAADAILMWNKAGGRVLRGLVRRREAERSLFLTPPASTPAPPISDPSPPAKKQGIWQAVLAIFRHLFEKG